MTGASSRKLELLVLCVACACALLWTAAAQGAPAVEVINCDPVAGLGAPDWTSFGAGNFPADNHCATGGGLQIANQGALDGEMEGLWTPLPPEFALRSVSFDIEGGDTSSGARYGIVICDTCAPDYPIGDRAPGDPPQTVTVDPAVGNMLAFFAECQNPIGCEARPTPLKISNIHIKADDSTPPTVSATVDGAPLDGDQFLGWTNRQIIPVGIDASDQGIGLWTGQVEIGDSHTALAGWDWSGNCISPPVVSFSGICPNSRSEAQAIDVSALADGTYDVTASADDALTNRGSTVSRQIGLDRTPPPPPTGVTVDPVTPGWPGRHWTSDPLVGVRWNAQPAPDDPSTESPPADTIVGLRRDGSSALAQQKVASTATELTPLTLSTDGDWQLSVRFTDEAGNPGEPTVRSIGLDHDHPKPPVLTDPGWFSLSDLYDGRSIAWTAPADDPSLESGVCGYVVRADKEIGAEPELSTDERTTETSWRLPAGLEDGVNYFSIRTVSCAGLLSETASTPLMVDLTPPQVDVQGLPAVGAWATSAVSAQVLASDSGSGVVRVGYSIDGASPVWSDGDGVSAAIPAGIHTFAAQAQDLAGNIRHGDAQTVLIDSAAPAVDLEPVNPDDPTKVEAHVRDTGSGLAAASVEIRRVDGASSAGEREWRTIGGAEPLVLGATGEITLRRTIADDELPAGTYELRVNARDVAGNSSIAGDFSLRSLRLPLRAAVDLSAAVADVVGRCRTAEGKRCVSTRHCAKKLRCRRVAVVKRNSAKRSLVRSWSAKSALVGEALDAGGRPVVGARVEILATPEGGDAQPLGSAATDSHGRYQFRLPKGPTRTLTARLEGNASHRHAEATARRGTRADISFDLRPRWLRSGGPLRLSGRIKHPQWLPQGGVTVTLEYLTPFGWQLMGSPMTTDAKGRFSLRYPWRAVARRSSALIHAHVERVNGFPFAEGSSRAVRVHVLPAR